MTIEQFIRFAKVCQSKPELSSLAKANGISLSKSELDEIFKKVSSGRELGEEDLSGTSGGLSAYGRSELLRGEGEVIPKASVPKNEE